MILKMKFISIITTKIKGSDSTALTICKTLIIIKMSRNQISLLKSHKKTEIAEKFACLYDIKTQLITFFSKSFGRKYSSRLNLKGQMISEIVLNSVVTMQMISIFWYPTMPITNWSSWATLWKILRYVRIDAFCDYFGMIEYCFIGASSIVGSCVIFIVLTSIIYWHSKKSLGFLNVIVRKGVIGITNLGCIPIQILCCVVFKYSTFNASKVQEYENYDLHKLDLGVAGSIFSFLTLVLLIILAYLVELFGTDIRHSVVGKNIMAKPNSNLDLTLITLSTIQVLFYVFLDEQYVIYYQLIFLFITIAICYRWINAVPYYSSYENIIKICRISCKSIVLIVFLLGYAMDNSLVVSILSIVITPLAMAAISMKLYRRCDLLSPRKFFFLSQMEFEQSIRHLLVSENTENKDKVLNLFSECYKPRSFRKNKLLSIWEANYCLFILKDPRLARVKLTKSAFTKPCLEGDIQEDKIYQKLDKKKSDLPEVEYLDYLSSLESTKDKDEEMCYILLDLWNEIASRSPRISKLTNMFIKVNDLTKTLKSSYESLASKNKRSDVFDLYGTFLENILGDYEGGEIVLKKKVKIGSLDMMIGYQKKLEDYDETLSIILISASFDSFGVISYINSKAAQNLKTQKSDAIGINFSSFIPKPYCNDHNENMRKLYMNCTNTILDKPKDFFLQDQEGHLFECNILFKFTNFNSNPYIIATLRPGNKLRQIILVSEEGDIYSFSALIPHVLSIEEQNLRGSNIMKYFPSLVVKDMPPFEPQFLKFRGKLLGIIHSIKKVKSTTIHLLLVINDKKEIKKWREGQAEEQVEYFGGTANVKWKAEMINDESTISSVNFERIRTRFATNYIASIEKFREDAQLLLASKEKSDEEEEEEADIKSLSVVQSNSQAIGINRLAIDHLQKTERSIKVYIYVLLISTLVMIALNAGILALIYKFASNTNTMKVFTHLSNMMYLVGGLPDLMRNLFVEIAVPGSYNLTADIINLNNTINGLDSMQDTLMQDLNTWTYCDASWIVTKQIIPVWRFDDLPVLQKHDLMRTLDLFKKHGYRMIDTLTESTNYNMLDYRFLWLNSLTFTYDYLNHALEQLVECERNRIVVSGESIQYFLICGIIVLAMCVVILIFFTYLVKRKYDLFWRQVKKSIHIAYIQLKQAVIDRLLQVHGAEMTEESKKFIKLKDSKTFDVDTKIVLIFGRRLCFFVVVCLTYYFLTEFYLYDKCQTSLKERPKILENFIVRRAMLAKVGYYARESSGSIMQIFFPDYYDIPNPKKEYLNLIGEYKAKYKNLWETEIFNTLSGELKSRLFEHYDTIDRLEYFGNIPAANLILFDSYYISSPGKKGNSDLYTFFLNLTNLQSGMATDYNLADRDSKDRITARLNTIIYWTIAFSIGLALLFLLYYLPFLCKELKIMKSAQILPSLVPKFNA
ncbi:unnamed protein product [Blepharisma stoltei]|uniref:TmcB/TmcC TPR repeats domain-containing protein n=1 Tax=Blepharisma stoltei TaxID=1481888 RepID=A0AAU9K1L6_9CILI|nr:unnamed protein product [Blepharisma stoltei]